MAKKASRQKAATSIPDATEQASAVAGAYRHRGSKRKNIPPAKIAAEGAVPVVPKAQYAYSPRRPPTLRFDPAGGADKLPELLAAAKTRILTDDEARALASALRVQEPWLEWADKLEQHRRGFFEIDPVALHIHERVSAQAILKIAARQDIERSLFGDPEQAYHEAVQFYRHDIDWTNRLILGDSLQVMSSLARREDLAGKVQMIYMDPPYGIKFASNFQPEVGKRDVKDKESDLTREPEMVKAYRDTWHLGIHSYLSYLRDRLILAKELLADTGSIFVQIGDENVHLILGLLDELFGRANRSSLIPFKKTGGQSANELPAIVDYIAWYAKDRERLRYHQLYNLKTPGDEGATNYTWLEMPTGERRSRQDENDLGDENGGRVFQAYPLFSSGPSAGDKPLLWNGMQFIPSPNSHWKTTAVGLDRLAKADRLLAQGRTLRMVNYLADYPVTPITNVWSDTQISGFNESRAYVVQTLPKVIERCMLMTTDPGDLVLDPTCGSGTTAYVAEQWGRRWITTDTSRVALSIARQRLLTAKYDFYKLRPINDDDVQRNPNGVWLSNGDGGQARHTFQCKSVPHVTLKSIAQNQNLDPIFAKHEPILDARLSRANKALARTTEANRQTLCSKLASAAAREAMSVLTDADIRRWLLPATKPEMVAQAFARAFQSFEKRPPTAKQVKSITDRIPKRATIGESNVPTSGVGWEHWQVPFDTDPDWPAELINAVTEYRQAWRTKMDEVNACIAANAQQEELVDQPEKDSGVVRVSGPFTVEAAQPPEMSLGDVVDVDGAASGFDGAPAELDETFETRFVEPRPDMDVKNIEAYLDQMMRLLRTDGVGFPNNKQKNFTRLDRMSGGSLIHAEGRWVPKGETDADPEGKATVAVGFGPQYGPVTAKQLEDLIRTANRRGYEDVVIAGFSFDGAAQAVLAEDPNPGIRVHMANIRPDVNPGMNGLLKEQPGSQLFTVFGQPRTRAEGPDDEGQYTVFMDGVDIYNPVDNSITPTGADKVAAWFLDGDYDGRTFCITQAFFPDRSAWEKLSKALNGPGGIIDADRFEALSGTVSLPFPAGKHKCAAVKVIDPRGNEVMCVHRLEDSQ